MSSKLDDVISKIEDIHKIITGGDRPEEGLCFRLVQIEQNVKDYHEEDERMHKLIWKFLVFFTVMIILNISGMDANEVLSAALKVMGS